MHKTLLPLLALLLTTDIYSQIVTRRWTTALDYTLLGPVKTWTKYEKDNLITREVYDTNGVLISYSGERTATYTPAPSDPKSIRVKWEAPYRGSKPISKDTILRLNGRGQVTKMKVFIYTGALEGDPKRTLGYRVSNTFDLQGRLTSSETYSASQRFYAWGSTHHESPGYFYLEEKEHLALFDYNRHGITRFQYYADDPYDNEMITYEYDRNGNLIQELQYDYYNMPMGAVLKDLFRNIIKAFSKGEFDIDRIQPGFWETGKPSKSTWTYNDLNQRMEYNVYSSINDQLTFRATWEYDAEGRKTKEIHHDTYHDTIREELWFDEYENVIKETRYDYWNKTSVTYRYELEYYE